MKIHRQEDMRSYWKTNSCADIPLLPERFKMNIIDLEQGLVHFWFIDKLMRTVFLS